jgi:hypothetical protein
MDFGPEPSTWGGTEMQHFVQDFQLYAIARLLRETNISHVAAYGDPEREHHAN